MMKRESNKSILFFTLFFAMVLCGYAGGLSLNRLKFGVAESVLGVLAGPFVACVTGDHTSIGPVQISMGAGLIFSVVLYILSVWRGRWQLVCGLFFLLSWFCWLFIGACYFAYWL